MPDSRPDTELSNPQSTKPPLDPHLKALENDPSTSSAKWRPSSSVP